MTASKINKMNKAVAEGVKEEYRHRLLLTIQTNDAMLTVIVGIMTSQEGSNGTVSGAELDEWIKNLTVEVAERLVNFHTTGLYQNKPVFMPTMVMRYTKRHNRWYKRFLRWTIVKIKQDVIVLKVKKLLTRNKGEK